MLRDKVRFRTITQGRTIGITVGGFSTVEPSISYSRSMSVTVSSASTQSFTFTANPGHVFYPGTISFSARDTNLGVRFGIDLKGQYGDTQSEIGFKLGGGSFEDDAWKSFLAKFEAASRLPRSQQQKIAALLEAFIAHNRGA